MNEYFFQNESAVLKIIHPQNIFTLFKKSTTRIATIHTPQNHQKTYRKNTVNALFDNYFTRKPRKTLDSMRFHK